VWVAAAVVAVAANGSVVTAGPAQAATSAAATAASTPEEAAADREFVRWLSVADARANLKAAAWAVLLAKDVDKAVAKFLASGYEYSRDRATKSLARNTDFAERILRTHLASYSPWVHAAARYALDNGAAALDAFARTGYAQAREKDRLIRQEDSDEAAAIRKTDRDFVAMLRDTAPGPQVQKAAALALRDGATDADVAEFFAFDWLDAADVDTATHRTRTSDIEMQWRFTIRGLVADAQAAEEAARGLEGEAAALKRAEAARAWANVGAKTAPARHAWDEAERIAGKQAETWSQIAAAAAAAVVDNPNWRAVAAAAPATQEQWAADRALAEQQSASWKALYEQARAAELDLSTPVD
jgi:hypothetical protein